MAAAPMAVVTGITDSVHRSWWGRGHHEVGHIAVCPSTVWEDGDSNLDDIRPYKGHTSMHQILQVRGNLYTILAPSQNVKICERVCKTTIRFAYYLYEQQNIFDFFAKPMKDLRGNI